MKIALLVPVLLLCSLASADVAAVRRAVARVDATKLVVKSHDRSDLSAEGAQISVYRDSKRATRKIVARIYGEGGQMQETIYLQNGLPLFVFSVEQRYVAPIGASPNLQVASRIETRLYFDKGHLLEKRIGKKILSLTPTQKRAVETETKALIRSYL